MKEKNQQRQTLFKEIIFFAEIGGTLMPLKALKIKNRLYRSIFKLIYKK